MVGRESLIERKDGFFQGKFMGGHGSVANNLGCGVPPGSEGGISVGGGKNGRVRQWEKYQDLEKEMSARLKERIRAEGWEPGQALLAVAKETGKTGLIIDWQTSPSSRLVSMPRWRLPGSGEGLRKDLWFRLSKRKANGGRGQRIGMAGIGRSRNSESDRGYGRWDIGSLSSRGVSI